MPQKEAAAASSQLNIAHSEDSETPYCLRIYIISSSSNTASQQPQYHHQLMVMTVESEYRHMLDSLLKSEEQSSQWYQVSPSPLVQDVKNVLGPSQRWRHKICDW